MRVSVVCRSNYEAVRRNGITTKTAIWGAGHFRPDRVSRSPFELRHVPFDYVVCANKATASTNYGGLSSVVGKKTVLVSAQNGVGVEAPLQRCFPEQTVLSGIVYIACNQPSPGVFAQTSSINTHSLALGSYRDHNSTTSNQTQQSQQLQEFASLDATFRVSQDVLKEKWTKQIWNGAFNPITALSGLNTHQILASPKHVEMIRHIMKETCQVARASGVSFEDHIIEQLLATTRTSAAVYPSMLQDAIAGKPMEIEPLSGKLRIPRHPKWQLTDITRSRQRMPTCRHLWPANTDSSSCLHITTRQSDRPSASSRRRPSTNASRPSTTNFRIITTITIPFHHHRSSSRYRHHRSTRSRTFVFSYSSSSHRATKALDSKYQQQCKHDKHYAIIYKHIRP